MKTQCTVNGECRALKLININSSGSFPPSKNVTFVRHVKQSGNIVNHATTRKARDVENLQVWLEDVPHKVLPFVIPNASQLYFNKTTSS